MASTRRFYVIALAALQFLSALYASHARLLPAENKVVNVAPCALMGNVNLRIPLNLTVDTCEEFHTGSVAIKLADDTDTVKYGDLRCTSNPSTCELKDRNGTTYQFDSDLLPEYFATYRSANASMSQMVFKAEFDDAEIIIAVSLVLLIDQRAMMRPFMGLSFTGQVVNTEQWSARRRRRRLLVPMGLLQQLFNLSSPRLQ
jgi:hypothetical protein